MGVELINIIFEGGEPMKTNKILKLRKKAKLTQDALAKKVCVNRSVISAWEHDKASPRSDKLKPLASALNCQVTDLL